MTTKDSSKQADFKYCKLVSYTNILKTRGNDKLYQEAIEASSKFNKRLFNERKMRIPFIDSQTTVAQANCMIWNMEYQRTKTDREGYIYSYPVKRWFKNRRLAFENDSSNMLHRLQLPSDIMQQQMNTNENGGSLMDPNSSAYHHHIPTNLGTHHHHHHHHHHQSHNHANHHQHNHHHSNHHHHQVSRGESSSSSNDMKSNGRSGNTGLDHNEWHDSYDNLNDVNNDNDADSDADDFEDTKKGKKTKRGRGKKANTKESTAAANGDDKPFVCSHCGVKYKTKPGLSYHIQKAHGTNSSSTPSSASHNLASNASKSHDLIENENTNSVFESVYDDMNSSSSLPQVSSQQASTNFSATLQANNIHSINGKNAANRCGTCNGTEQETRSGQHEAFVTCCECNKSFHPICLNFTPNMIKSIKKIKWQCIECKRCTICGNSENDDKLLFCDDCDRGYHMYCLNPPLTVAPEGDWRCEPCVKEYGAQ